MNIFNIKLRDAILVMISTSFALSGCTAAPQKTVTPKEVEHVLADQPTEGFPLADVLSVQVSGDAGAYMLSVEISSPDTGCEQYADWWEVIDEDGYLIYRRILAHSHVGEQPFTRSGGPVPIEAETVVWIRAHMNPGGYGSSVLQGSVQNGFFPAVLSPDFAADLEESPPLPESCAF